MKSITACKWVNKTCQNDKYRDTLIEYDSGCWFSKGSGMLHNALNGKITRKALYFKNFLHSFF